MEPCYQWENIVKWLHEAHLLHAFSMAVSPLSFTFYCITTEQKLEKNTLTDTHSTISEGCGQYSPSVILPVFHSYHNTGYLKCGDLWQIWMWFKESNKYFCQIENFLNEKLTTTRNGLLHWPLRCVVACDIECIIVTLMSEMCFWGTHCEN